MEESQAKAVTPGCAGTIHFEPSAWKVRGKFVEGRRANLFGYLVCFVYLFVCVFLFFFEGISYLLILLHVQHAEK